MLIYTLFLCYGSSSGEFPTVITAAAILAFSFLRDVQGVRVTPAIPSGPSSPIIRRDLLLRYTVSICFHCLDRI